MNKNFKDDNHALQTGMFVGLMVRLGMVAHPQLDADSDYTDEVVIDDPESGAHWHVKVLPPDFGPPEEPHE